MKLKFSRLFSDMKTCRKIILLMWGSLTCYMMASTIHNPSLWNGIVLGFDIGFLIAYWMESGFNLSLQRIIDLYQRLFELQHQSLEDALKRIREKQNETKKSKR